MNPDAARIRTRTLWISILTLLAAVAELLRRWRK